MSLIDFLGTKKVIESTLVPKIKKELVDAQVPLEEHLKAYGVTPKQLVAARSEYYNIPTKDLSKVQVPFAILQYIPEESAQHYAIVPINIADGFLEVGMIDPENIEARDALNFISAKVNMPFKVFLITLDDFKKVLEVYKGLSGQVNQALDDLEGQFATEDNQEITTQKKVALDPNQPTIQTTIIEDAPVTKIVATILRYAVEGDASDVHVEPLRDRVRVRFRVDGALNTSLILPSKVHNAVVARIKILSALKLDEKRKPQDGRFSARIDGRKVDFRVSTFPAYYGEKVVMRILDQDKGVKKIDDLGISSRNLDLIRKGVRAPYGLVLISGPTGSGKTTTLYSILDEVDRETNNVLSLEDPVEYSIEGVSQSQVRPEIGYTFATGLRTTLRQDPDIILVGEIRDGETAKLAIQAALTGHLVFSTIHTNSAAGIIPRLIDMGVDPYLIAPTLIIGMAQRLVRKNGPGAGRVEPIDGSVRQMIDSQFADVPEQYRNLIPSSQEILRLAPSPECPSGTRGREAVFEVFEMTKELENVIMKSPTESAVYDVVRSQGMLTMKEDALIKAMQKRVPFEEVYKL